MLSLVYGFGIFGLAYQLQILWLYHPIFLIFVYMIFGWILWDILDRPRGVNYYREKLSGCSGNIQELDIRNHLSETNSKIYNMSMLIKKKILLGLT